MVCRSLLLTLILVMTVAGGSARLASTPIGLSLFFSDGTMAPLTLVGDAPRYLQEIDIMATVPSATDDGIDPIIEQGDLSRLDWTGVHQVEEDWRPAGDGTFQRQRFYRGARWMEGSSDFKVFPANGMGEILDEPFVLQAGRDDRLLPSNDAFVRRFVARADCHRMSGGRRLHRRRIHGAGARAGAARPEGRAAGSDVAGQHTTAGLEVERMIRRATAASSCHTCRPAVRRSHMDSTCESLRLDCAPAAGDYYVPGEVATFRLMFRDGAGTLLHPPASLPTYGEFFRGEVTSGLRYYDNFRLNPTTFYALKHRGIGTA